MGTRTSSARLKAVEGGRKPAGREDVHVSAIIPCLNEELTLGICIRKAQEAFSAVGTAAQH